MTGSFSVGRLFGWLAIFVAGHAVVVGGAFVAGRIAEPSVGGGYEDVAAVVSVLVLGEIVLFVAAIVAIIVLLVKRRFDAALGALVGAAAGPIAATLVALAQQGSPN